MLTGCLLLKVKNISKLEVREKFNLGQFGRHRLQAGTQRTDCTEENVEGTESTGFKRFIAGANWHKYIPRHPRLQIIS